MREKVFFSCAPLPPGFSFRDSSYLFQSSQNLVERCAVELVVAAIDVTYESSAIYYERRRMRDVDGIGGEGMMETVSFGHRAILVEQKNTGDGMLFEKPQRSPDAISLFRRNEHQLCSRCFNFRHSRLELSHALHAVRSPGAAHELQNQHAFGEKEAESKSVALIPIRRS